MLFHRPFLWPILLVYIKHLQKSHFPKLKNYFYIWPLSASHSSLYDPINPFHDFMPSFLKYLAGSTKMFHTPWNHLWAVEWLVNSTPAKYFQLFFLILTFGLLQKWSKRLQSSKSVLVVSCNDSDYFARLLILYYLALNNT